MARLIVPTWAKAEKVFAGVHPDLLAVMRRGFELSPVLWIGTCGLRTLEEQKRLKAAKATTTLKSRHLTGHAVDIAPVLDGVVRWDWPLFHRIAPAIKQAAAECGVPIEWGGDWQTFPDGPHWQLPVRQYPARKGG